MSGTSTSTTLPPPSTTQYSNQPQAQAQAETESKNPTERLALPEIPSAKTTLDVSTGEAVKLDHLGPMVVNVDGTLSAVNNWGEMSELERKATLRVLGKRNKERLERLKSEAAKQGGGE
jgi:hypothetical protein